MHPEYEAVIGLEVHAQLATQSKIFCDSPARLEKGVSVSEIDVNINVGPVDAGHPGTLPTVNRSAVDFAIRAGLATGCEIRRHNVFARKHYFYPDLPKGYQITQFDKPICEGGKLDIETADGVKTIGITRIHMEDDAGKNVHMSGYSLVNLNRAGMPLIEIVSEPDMRTPEEAGAYLRKLHAVLTHVGICDGNMQEGNFRCDANVSIRRRGETQFGTRSETKNLNSFRFVEKAIEFEIARHIEVIQAGGTIVQETRNYDSTKNVTTSLRTKEEAHDYRYFPDPDLMPVVISEDWIEKVRSELPELPHEKKERFVSEFGLSDYDAGVLTSSKSMSECFESTLNELKSGSGDLKKTAKTVSNLLTGEIARLMKEEDRDIPESQLTSTHLAAIVGLIQKGALSNTNGKKVIVLAWQAGGDVNAIVEKEGLAQVSDTSALEPIIAEVIEKHPKQVEQYRGGKDKLLGFFVGQVMKATKGQANPGLLQGLIQAKLDEGK